MGFNGNVFSSLRIGRSVIAACAALTMSCAIGTTSVHAAELAPQTKFRMKVVQWIPVKSAYEEWGALGGDFTISTTGDIALPVVGQISTTGMSAETLAAEVAGRLQKQTGLVNKPEVSVQIIEYPPIYVAGDVTAPGEYKFREDMTVMQAIAVAGGQRRGVGDAFGTVRLISDLKSSNDDIVRLTARIARLQAELDGAKEVNFPDMPEIDSLGSSNEIFNRERILFEARNEEAERQIKSLTELRDLYQQEISVLEQKRSASEQSEASAERELEGVAKLVDKGFAVASRKSEMERAVMGFKSDTLDQTTAIMRARQGAAEATRNLDSVQDKRRSEAAKEMQDAKSLLQQAMLKRDTTQKLLVDSMGQPSQKGSDESPVKLTIVRVVNGEAAQIEATEMTMLQPGDVVNAKLKVSPDMQVQPDTASRDSSKSASQ